MSLKQFFRGCILVANFLQMCNPTQFVANMQSPGNTLQCKLTNIIYLFRWRQFAREEDPVQGPRQLPLLRKRPRSYQNAPTAGKLTQTLVQASNASNMEVTYILPPMQKKLARIKGVTWRRYTLWRSKTSSCKRSTLKVRSGLERGTMTWTEHGNGLTGPVLTSPTGCLVSLMVGSTTHSWTFLIPVLGSGTICTTATTIIIFASLPFEELPYD